MIKKLLKRLGALLLICMIVCMILSAIDAWVFHNELPHWLVMVRNAIAGTIVGLLFQKKIRRNI